MSGSAVVIHPSHMNADTAETWCVFSHLAVHPHPLLTPSTCYLDRAYKARHMAYTMNKLVAIPSMSSMSACLGWPWATGGIDAGSNDVMVTLRVGVGLRVHQEGVADSAQRRRANFAN